MRYCFPISLFLRRHRTRRIERLSPRRSRLFPSPTAGASSSASHKASRDERNATRGARDCFSPLALARTLVLRRRITVAYSHQFVGCALAYTRPSSIIFFSPKTARKDTNNRREGVACHPERDISGLLIPRLSIYHKHLFCESPVGKLFSSDVSVSLLLSPLG